MKKLNSATNFLELKIIEIARRPNPIENSTTLVQILCAAPPSEHELLDTIAITALRNIDQKEKLYVGHGSE